MNAKMMIIFKKVNKEDLNNYRPICLPSNIHEVLRTVFTKRVENTFDETLPQGQAINTK